MNPFLLALLQTLEPLALEELKTALAYVNDHLNHPSVSKPKQ